MSGCVCVCPCASVLVLVRAYNGVSRWGVGGACGMSVSKGSNLQARPRESEGVPRLHPSCRTSISFLTGVDGPQGFPAPDFGRPPPAALRAAFTAGEKRQQSHPATSRGSGARSDRKGPSESIFCDISDLLA